MIDRNSIPANWEGKTLGEICEIIMGQSPSSDTYNSEGIGLPFFQGKAEFTNLHPKVEKWCSVPNKIAQINDILLSVRAPVGAINIADQVSCIGRGLAAIRYKNHKFIFYFLKLIQHELDKQGTGTTFRAISGEIIRTTKINVPPPTEQQKIVAKIEELFSELDKSKQQLETAQQQLKVYRQAVLKWAFEGKLTAAWREKQQTSTDAVQLRSGAHEERSRGADPSSPQEESGLPEGWEWIQIKNVCYKIQDGSHFSPQVQYQEPGENRFMYITAKNIRNNYMDLSKLTYVDKEFHESIYARCNPEYGDVLLTKDGVNTGEVTTNSLKEPFSLLSSVCVFKTKENELKSEYLKYFIQSPTGNKLIDNSMTGTAIKRIILRKIREAYFFLPPVTEQQEIVQEIESRLTVCDKIEETITASLQQAETLRQSILKKAFEGKLIKPEKQPVTKPANDYFFQLQILALITKASKQKNIRHGEMTIAKYAYLADKIYDIPTHYQFERWHLGPYPPEIKKAIKNKKFFTINNSAIDLVDEKALLKYNNPYQQQIETAIYELAGIFSKYTTAERPHKTELLATVCKVIEDIKSVTFNKVRQSMKEWKIDLKNSPYKNKAEKFTEEETKKCLDFIIEKGWDKKLVGQK